MTSNPSSVTDGLLELTTDEILASLRAISAPSRSTYHAMYSTWFGGLTRDPALMMVPIDDHLVHRGDGVFEAVKCLDGRIYALDPHLERLARSAQSIGMKLAKSINEIREICVLTAKFAIRERPEAKDSILRIYNSRGPGDFSTNPQTTLGEQLYVVIAGFKPLGPQRYETGASGKFSRIAVKEGFFATVKSCNYLPNVLMKKEALDEGVDFTISLDENGYVAEGSTENFAVVGRENELLVPGFSRTLKGVTLTRALEFANDLVSQGLLKGVRLGAVSRDAVDQAEEAMVFSTTLDCLAVTKFEGRAVGRGIPGPVSQAFKTRFDRDLKAGPSLIEL